MSVFVVIEIAGGKRLVGLGFRKSTVVLGRSPDCDVVLPDPSVLGRHATLRKRGHVYLVFAETNESPPDLSNPGDRAPVPLEVESPVGFEDGATLVLGRVRLRLFATRPEDPAIEWSDGGEFERRVVELSLEEHGLPHGRRDVTRALRELRAEASAPPGPKRSGRAPTSLPNGPSLDRDRALAFGLGVALLVVLAALYWLFRADTPRSL